MGLSKRRNSWTRNTQVSGLSLFYSGSFARIGHKRQTVVHGPGFSLAYSWRPSRVLCCFTRTRTTAVRERQRDTRISTPSARWHIYLIRAGDGSLYVGIATDVARRYAEHQSNGGRCARYLRGRGPLRLVFKRRLGSRSLALKVERRIRRLRRHQKDEIVRSNPTRWELIERLAIQSGDPRK